LLGCGYEGWFGRGVSAAWGRGRGGGVASPPWQLDGHMTHPGCTRRPRGPSGSSSRCPGSTRSPGHFSRQGSGRPFRGGGGRESSLFEFSETIADRRFGGLESCVCGQLSREGEEEADVECGFVGDARGRGAPEEEERALVAVARRAAPPAVAVGSKRRWRWIGTLGSQARGRSPLSLSGIPMNERIDAQL
jgi:hypothetical protein